MRGLLYGRCVAGVDGAADVAGVWCILTKPGDADLPCRSPRPDTGLRCETTVGPQYRPVYMFALQI